MTKRDQIWVVVILCMALFLSSLVGCSNQKSSAAKKPQGSAQSKSDTPESFTQLLNSTEKLIVDMGGKTKKVQIRGMQDQSSQNGASSQNAQGQQSQQGQQGQQSQQSQQGQQGQQGQQNQQGQQQAGQSNQQGQQSQQGQGQTGQSQQSGQGSQTSQTGQGQNTGTQQTNQSQQNNQNTASSTDWSQAQNTLKDLHQAWNTLEPEATRGGLTMEARDGFEKVLEDLTKQIASQKPEESMVGAVELYGYFSEMARVLKTDLPPSFFRLKYEIMATTVQAGMQEWDVAKAHAAGLMPQSDMLKSKEDESNTQLFDQLDYALNDLKRAVDMKEKDLVMIRSEIAMKNLEQLKKKLTTQSTSQTNTGGGY